MSPDNRLPKPAQDVIGSARPQRLEGRIQCRPARGIGQACPYGARSVEALSWTSGFIEGKASARPARRDGHGG